MMGEMVYARSSSFDRYEELLLRRENLKKEAFRWEREYVRVFGDRILKLFEMKLECIRKKKTISFCQVAANHGEHVNQEDLQKYLAEEMAAYQAQLEAMIEDNEAAKDVYEVSENDVLEIKKIYRRLAKQLHPDINSKASEIAELRELWERISIAYKCNQLKDMKELEVIALAALKASGEGKIEVEIPNIAEKIAEVEAEIESIRNTDPYMYKFILTDDDAVQEKNEILDEEYASYKEYSGQLDEILRSVMKNGVIFTWRMN